MSSPTETAGRSVHSVKAKRMLSEDVQIQKDIDPIRKKKRRRKTPEYHPLDNPFLEEDDAKTIGNQPSQKTTQTPQFIHPKRNPSVPYRCDPNLTLPSHLATLLSLHNAVEHALVIHLATVGTAGSSFTESKSQKGQNILVIPDLIKMSVLRPLVERSSGRRFGKQELGRLAWLWGVLPDEDDVCAGSNIGFCISQARTTLVEEGGTKRSSEYTLGIHVKADDSEDDARVNPSTPGRIASTSSPLQSSPRKGAPSPRSDNVNVFSSPTTSLYARRGISAVAAWNNGADHRKRIIKNRLQQWSLDCLAAWRATSAAYNEEDDGHKYIGQNHNNSDAQSETALSNTPRTPHSHVVIDGFGGLITPSETHQKVQEQPEIEVRTSTVWIDAWDAGFPIEQIVATPLAKLPALSETDVAVVSPFSSPTKPTRLQAAREAQGVAITKSEESLGRKLTLTERIRLKEETQQQANRRKHGNVSQDIESANGNVTYIGPTSANGAAMEARKRSSLSRLQDVAESVYMLFLSKQMASLRKPATSTRRSSTTLSKDSSISSPSTSSLHFTPLALPEVIKAICSASKSSVSMQDARVSLTQLQCIVPGFLEITRIGQSEWVRLINGGGDDGSTTNSSLSNSEIQSLDESSSSNTATTTSDRHNILHHVRQCIRAEVQRIELVKA